MTPGKRTKRKQGPEAVSKRAFKEMTVAHVRETPGAEFAEVVFLESARFYKLFKENKNFQRIQHELRHAAEEHAKVRVFLNVSEGDVIQDVQAGG